MADIDALTVDDIPKWYSPRLSIAKARRDAVILSVEAKLRDTFFVMAWNYEGMQPTELNAARALFPPTTVCRSFKNTLVRRAMMDSGWACLGEKLMGANMFVFVSEDNDVKPTVQAYLQLEKKFARVSNLATTQENAQHPWDIKPLVGGCLRDEWKFIPPEDFQKLKDFPTKTELIGKIAGSIKQVTQKVAVSVNQLPQKLAIGTKKIVEKMEEEGKSTVGDVVA